MQVFLYVNLITPATYSQPLLQEIKISFPQVAVLDMDAQSGELVQHYALQLLQEAELAIVCIKANESINDISALMPLLEELFQDKPGRLVLLLGQHARLQRMFAARQSIKYKAVGEEEAVAEVQSFFVSVK
ncbi:hypothetical protein [Pontibacter sp. H249]|uniref:hypothetical protein n=1 Tax=Pontibacter sp. H249 TaxID=3133420 RepID=UPI0030C1399F